MSKNNLEVEVARDGMQAENLSSLTKEAFLFFVMTFFLLMEGVLGFCTESSF